MALIKYGGGIVQMSGSIAGSTHARNRFGNYARARTKPINPKSPRQSGARISIMYLAEAWREAPMDDAKRLAWETYAASVSWQNKLGETVKLTGFNMFIRSNAALVRDGRPIVTDGPTDLGLPPGDPDFVISNCRAWSSNGDLAFNQNLDWCKEDGASFVIDMGLPQNPTRNFFGGPWRYITHVSGNALTPAESPMPGMGLAAWTFIEGQKVWFRAHIIRADGRVSTKFRCDPVIVLNA